ncbi:MAG: insulinase family protein [Cyclobacteriaceae bacterium]|nr:insulinase family protein [Cyclobacteriaceae bacterium]
MLNRAVAPNFKEIDRVVIQEVQKETLSNGIPMFYLNSGTEEVIRLELVFQAGKYYENQSGLNLLMAATIGEGTKSFDSKTIRNTFDRYGVFWSAKSGYDLFSFQFYLMAKHLDKVLPIIQELITSATFPEEEVEIVKEIKKQEIQLNNSKTNVVSSQLFKEKLFGSEHPYGRRISEENIATLNSTDLINYYKQTISKNTFEIFLCGKIEVDTMKLISEELGSLVIDKQDLSSETKEVVSLKSEYIPWKDALQTSISMGNITLQKGDKDYYSLLFTTILLGGYFGSRLMKNVREEKGLTYGIHASIKHLARHSYFSIHADVMKEKLGEAQEAIKEELEKIAYEPIPEDELQTVKNYITGSFLTSLNTPFSLMDTFTSLYFHGQDYNFIQNYIKHLRQIDSTEVNRIANTYLKPSAMIEVSVG